MADVALGKLTFSENAGRWRVKYGSIPIATLNQSADGYWVVWPSKGNFWSEQTIYELERFLRRLNDEVRTRVQQEKVRA